MDQNIRNVISTSRDRCWCYVKSLLNNKTFRLRSFFNKTSLMVIAQRRCHNCAKSGLKQLRGNRLDDIIAEYRNIAPANGTTGTRAVEYCWIHNWTEFALPPDLPYKADRTKDRRGTRITVVVVNSTIHAYMQSNRKYCRLLHECMNAVGQDERLALRVFSCYQIFNANCSIKKINIEHIQRFLETDALS